VSYCGSGSTEQVLLARDPEVPTNVNSAVPALVVGAHLHDHYVAGLISADGSIISCNSFPMQIYNTNLDMKLRELVARLPVKLSESSPV
jgi:hypothetical protein